MISLGVKVLVIQELTTELYKTIILSLLYFICFQRLRFYVGLTIGTFMMQYIQVYPWAKCHSFPIDRIANVRNFTLHLYSNSGLASFLSAKKFIALQTANCNLHISLVSVSFASIYFQISLI